MPVLVIGTPVGPAIHGPITFTGGPITFNPGVAILPGEYQVGRDADATNQLHFNVPTGATFEFSVNDVAQVTLNGSGVLAILATTGNTLVVDTNVLVVDATNNRVGVGTTAPASQFSVNVASGTPILALTIADANKARLYATAGAANTGTLIFQVPKALDDLLDVLAITGVGAAAETTGNVGFNTSTQFGGGFGVIGLLNASAVPGSNPVGAGILYSEGGVLKWRGSGGQIVTLAGAAIAAGDGLFSPAVGAIAIVTGGVDRIRANATGIGVFAVAPVARAGAYTQTFATADKTMAQTVGAAVATTAATQTSPFGYTTAAQADDIVARINQLRIDLDDTQQMLNALIDDQQAYGWAQ